MGVGGKGCCSARTGGNLPSTSACGARRGRRRRGWRGRVRGVEMDVYCISGRVGDKCVTSQGPRNSAKKHKPKPKHQRQQGWPSTPRGSWPSSPPSSRQAIPGCLPPGTFAPCFDTPGPRYNIAFVVCVGGMRRVCGVDRANESTLRDTC